MLLLRYQRQHQLEAEEGRREPSEVDMRKRLKERDLKGESRRAATRGTLICIFVCGSLLLGLGLTLLLAGLLVPELKKHPAPWLVTGPTCIVLGILVLLLSVEIILKLRKISGSEGDYKDDDPKDKKNSKPGWGVSNGTEDLNPQPESSQVTPRIPVVIQPPTPVLLDPASLPLAVPENH